MVNYRTLDRQGHAKGKFIPKNPEKYKGKLPIVFRSTWELAFMRMCDLTPGVESWGSESVVIQYVDNTNPNEVKTRQYFVDFNMTVRSSDGKIQKYLIEIKPKSQTVPPKPPKSSGGVITEKAQATYMAAVLTYKKNMLKWSAAQRAAKSKGFKFLVLTEDRLFRKF